MGFHIILPARLKSERLPGKLTKLLDEKTVLQHTYEAAALCNPDSIVIATDSEVIKKLAESFSATVCMTSKHNKSGTERIAEAVSLLDYDPNDVIVGLQADEPFMPPALIKRVAEQVEIDSIKIVTACNKIKNIQEIFNPNFVKVILNHRKNAIYFSRAPIPWDRDEFSNNTAKKIRCDYYKHIGIYAYKASFLSEYSQLPQSSLEEVEMLEQLRILWHGIRINVIIHNEKVPHGIDTEEDLQIARDFVNSKKARTA